MIISLDPHGEEAHFAPSPNDAEPVIPYLRDIVRRLWPLMVGTVIGIWLNGGLLTGPYAPYGTVFLGVLLVVYAIVGLSKFNFKIARRDEKWIGGIVGLVTGVVSAATGVQV